jgi:hypothetical protein
VRGMGLRRIAQSASRSRHRAVTATTPAATRQSNHVYGISAVQLCGMYACGADLTAYHIAKTHFHPLRGDL